VKSAACIKEATAVRSLVACPGDELRYAGTRAMKLAGLLELMSSSEIAA
jgi:hypothetical protein